MGFGAIGIVDGAVITIEGEDVGEFLVGEGISTGGPLDAGSSILWGCGSDECAGFTLDRESGEVFAPGLEDVVEARAVGVVLFLGVRDDEALGIDEEGERWG